MGHHKVFLPSCLYVSGTWSFVAGNTRYSTSTSLGMSEKDLEPYWTRRSHFLLNYKTIVIIIIICKCSWNITLFSTVHNYCYYLFASFQLRPRTAFHDLEKNFDKSGHEPLSLLFFKINYLPKLNNRMNKMSKEWNPSKSFKTEGRLRK